jgi:hypothetical protein
MSNSETAGLVRMTGFVEPTSEVLALNHSTNVIAGQYTESGNYDFTIAAQAGDPITFWYVRGTVESPPIDFLIKVDPATP